MKCTYDQKKDLKGILESKDLRFLADIVYLIRTRFCIEYIEKQVRKIRNDFMTKNAKPYQIDYRKPDDADEKLKN